MRKADLVVVGAGAAGLATAVFCARHAPDRSIVCLDGATHIGAKILVSGGARCNVTNRVVTERDFWGGSPRAIARVLRAFPEARAAAFFNEIGVALHEEEDGKLFPDSNRARTVLDALLREMGRLGIALFPGERVSSIRRETDGSFAVETGSGRWTSHALVLATGGRSLPKTGSNGVGYGLAAALGHGYIETTPALAPLLLEGGMHATLTGVSHPAQLTIRSDGSHTKLHGALLWTHFGASGPVILNASRHWHRAQIEGRPIEVLLNVCPGETFESMEEWLHEQTTARPRAQVSTVLATRVPAAVAGLWAEAAGVSGTALAHMPRESRRRLVRALVESPLSIRDSRGYNFAEVTAGGVPLDEIDTATMESRVCSGLYLVGEILDVDGRLGGFNFQWAWSSGWVAARAIAQALAR